MKFVVVAELCGKKRYHVENGSFSETIGSWTQTFETEKAAQKVANRLQKKFHLIGTPWVEQVA